ERGDGERALLLRLRGQNPCLMDTIAADMNDDSERRLARHFHPADRQLTPFIHRQRVAFTGGAGDEGETDAVAQQMRGLNFHGGEIEGAVCMRRRMSRGDDSAYSER